MIVTNVIKYFGQKVHYAITNILNIQLKILLCICVQNVLSKLIQKPSINLIPLKINIQKRELNQVFKLKQFKYILPIKIRISIIFFHSCIGFFTDASWTHTWITSTDNPFHFFRQRFRLKVAKERGKTLVRSSILRGWENIENHYYFWLCPEFHYRKYSKE